MLGLSAPGPFARPNKVSRGPWFKEWKVTDDGLEYFYKYKDVEGNTSYLLSNNVPFQQREELEHLYNAYQRARVLTHFGGLYAGYEAITRIPALAKFKRGTRFVVMGAVGAVVSTVFSYFNYNNYYGPLFCAYFTKYANSGKTDLFEIQDEKREWFDIDTSQYMNYTNEDLHHPHTHHGPQPDGMELNNPWFTEMDKYLKGEESKIKEHPKWTEFEFTYADKGAWPTEEDITATFSAAGTD